MRTNLLDEIKDVQRLSEKTGMPTDQIIELYKVVETKRQNSILKDAFVVANGTPSGLEAIAMALGFEGEFKYSDSLPRAIRGVAEAIIESKQ